MTVYDIARAADAQCLCGCETMHQREIAAAFASDMMSDVLAYVTQDVLLITGLINAQVLRTAEMLDLACVLYVRGKKPDLQVIEMARELGITLLSTRYTMYEASGKLYAAGLRALNLEELMAANEVFSVAKMDFTRAGDVSARIKRTLKLLGVDARVIRRIAVATYEAKSIW